MTKANEKKVTVPSADFYEMWADESGLTQTDIEKAAKALAPSVAKAMSKTGLQKIEISSFCVIEERNRSGDVPVLDKNGKPTGKKKKYSNVRTASVRLGSAVLDGIKGKGSNAKLLEDFDIDTTEAILNGEIAFEDSDEDEYLDEQ